jgi:hypothetical protein
MAGPRDYRESFDLLTRHKRCRCTPTLRASDSIVFAHAPFLLGFESHRAFGKHLKTAPDAYGGMYILQGRCGRELVSEAIEQSGRASDIWSFYTCMTMKSSRNADQCRPPACGDRKSTLVQPPSSLHTLSLRGTDNPSSRNHLLRFYP